MKPLRRPAPVTERRVMTIPMIRGLAALSARYDGYIVDIWGVVHQGGPAFPEAVRCLQRLREAGKRVVFLSNAPRRAAIVAAILEAKGIAAALHDGYILICVYLPSIRSVSLISGEK